MNKMITFMAILGAVLILGSTAAPGADLITLDSAIQTAYENSPQLKSMAARERGAAARMDEARSGYRPRFSLSETMTRTDNPVYAFMSALNQRSFTPAMMNTINDPGAATNYNSKFAMQQAIYTGGKVSNALAAARRGRDAATLQASRARQQVRFQVISAYYGIILAKKRIDVTTLALETARAHAKVTADMFASGMIVESDKLSAQVRVSEIEEMKLTAETDLALARSALLMAMGVDQNRDFAVDPDAFEQKAYAIDLPSHVAKALANRPDFMAVADAIAAREHMVAVERADRKPMVFAQGSMDWDGGDAFGNEGDSYFLAVGVKWDIYNGGQTRAREDAARASVEELRWQREHMKQGIELEVRQAFYEVETAAAKLDVARQAVEQSEESYRIVNNRYNNGLAINVQVLAAEAARTEAQMRYLYALYQYSVGIEKLHLATGTN
jgi:outer membrane protein TolC